MGSASILRYPNATHADSTTPPAKINSNDGERPSSKNCPGVRPPSNSSSCRGQEVGQKLAEDKSDSDAESLKGRLNLDLQKCGSRTKTTGRPCNVRIIGKKRDEALTKLRSLEHLTQSSHNLETELRHLAKIVHCHHHDHDPFLRYRAQKWKSVFPLGDNDTNPDASVSNRVKDLFDELSDCCAGVKQGNGACRRRIGGRKVQNRSKTIEKIVKPEIYSDNCELAYFLEVLAENMYCHAHKLQGPKQVGVWKLEITKLRDEKGPSPSLGADDEGNQNQDFVKAEPVYPTALCQSAVDSGLRKHGAPLPRNSRSPSPAEFWPEIYDTTAFKILTRANHLEGQEISYPCVQKQLQTPLKKKDRQEGFLYAYEVEGNEGFVKIGYTARSTKERHDEWSFYCNRVSKPIYPLVSKSSVAVPNAARVEKLCHAELNHRNIRIYCDACLRLHIEWFEVSPSEAVAVIEKWTSWMRSHPYESNSADASRAWTLRLEEEQRSEDIDGFMKHLSLQIPNRQRLESPEIGGKKASSAAHSQQLPVPGVRC
ncbi:T5orf172 domain-containing protein [Aspergillus recurvatus]